ncbi:MAG: hypothetical protein ACPL28_07730 [bacterium]
MLILFLINFTLPGVLDRGDRIFYYDARSLGLGGNITVLENSINPASCGLTEKVQFIISGFLFSGTEKRGLRVYDSYGNNIGTSTISVNRTTEPDFTPAGLVMPLKFFRFGLKYYRVQDFNYLYHYDYRDDFYQIVKTVDNTYSGSLNSIAPFLGISYKGISIGLEQAFIYGAIVEELKTLFPEGEDSITNISYNLSGDNTKLGFMFAPSINFAFAYYYCDKLLVSDNDNSLNYPASHNFGILYQPPHRVPTKFVAEIDYELWNKPILVYKFGVEHTVLYNYFLRYGFCIFPDYNEPAIWTTNLTLGFGGQLRNYFFDLGYAFGKRDYANTDFGGLGIEKKYIFDETQNYFIFSFGFKI